MPLRPILDVAADLGLDPATLTTLGRNKAKVDPIDRRATPPTGRLVLVSAITPTPAGEGKTTVSVGLTQGLQRIGASVALCLREPSLGPVFGVKGGGTGGGQAQVEPADEINLHFTGDLHAISSAHNLLAAMVDTDLHFGGTTSGLTPATTTWARVVDMNDRALRKVIVDAGGKAERSTRFDITAASEVMAILALATSLDDLRARLARTVVGRTADGAPVTADALGATDAMVVLLREALRPNLVQTREGAPAFVHAGPFANIAHGCSSVVATDLALRHADVVVTEAGFGFDLGGEKFLDLKMRQAELWPRCVVLVATLRALRSHGGGDLTLGLEHLDRQLANVRAFGLPPLVALNVFPDDSEEDLRSVEAHVAASGAPSGRSTGYTHGGAGATELAERVLTLLEATDADPPTPRFLYREDEPVVDKLQAVARTIYGAADVQLSEAAQADLAWLRQAGFDRLPVCIAKTHLSLTDDPKGGGLARGFTPTVHELRLSAGAGFVVARMGRIFTMPGLPREPAAKSVRVRPDGSVRGLMQGD
ncbi:MAG: formate--tetrahydrofolate ligase [bacterium]|nr:formate--tetrahydrofolate ligase [bacterium]